MHADLRIHVAEVEQIELIRFAVALRRRLDVGSDDPKNTIGEGLPNGVVKLDFGRLVGRCRIDCRIAQSRIETIDTSEREREPDGRRRLESRAKNQQVRE
jgi:hypothetical protein